MGTHLLPPHEEGAQVGSVTFEMNEEQARRSKPLLLAEGSSAGASSRPALAAELDDDQQS
jgi:hypothetical protein